MRHGNQTSRKKKSDQRWRLRLALEGERARRIMDKAGLVSDPKAPRGRIVATIGPPDSVAYPELEEILGSGRFGSTSPSPVPIATTGCGPSSVAFASGVEIPSASCSTAWVLGSSSGHFRERASSSSRARSFASRPTKWSQAASCCRRFSSAYPSSCDPVSRFCWRRGIFIWTSWAAMA